MFRIKRREEESETAAPVDQNPNEAVDILGVDTAQDTGITDEVPVPLTTGETGTEIGIGIETIDARTNAVIADVIETAVIAAAAAASDPDPVPVPADATSFVDPTACPPLPEPKRPRILSPQEVAAVEANAVADVVMHQAEVEAAAAATMMEIDPQVTLTPQQLQIHIENAVHENVIVNPAAAVEATADVQGQPKDDSAYLASDDDEDMGEGTPGVKPEDATAEDEDEEYAEDADADTKKRKRSTHRTPWSEKIALLLAYKEKYKHCRVPQRSKENPELAQFTKKMREYYRLQKTGQYKGKLLTVARIKDLEDIGFEWEVRKVPNKTFIQRLEDLKGFKEETGHCNVPRVYKADVSLGRWCHVMRCSYWQVKENKKPMYKLQDEEIQHLEDAGFQWRVKKTAKTAVGEPKAYKSKQGKKTTSFEERIEQLKEYKEEHGHVRVTMGQNKNLAIFVNHMRGARRDPDKTNGVKLTKERIGALDALDFDWAPPRTKIRWSANEGREEHITFEERIVQLQKFKETWGHLNVPRKEDRSLSAFCHRMREDRDDPSKLSEEQTKALDEVGFVWEVEKGDKSEQPWVTFQDRLEQIKTFNEEHGHFRVTAKDDRALSLFCSDVRSAHRPGSKKTLTPERTKALDDIGFEWNPPKTVQPTSFEDRIEQLKAFKEKHGHVRVTERFDKKLASYCNNLRQARRKPEAGVMNISEDRIKSLDEIGFEWNIVNRSGPKGETKSFVERVEQLKAYKEKFGNLRVAPKVDKSLSNFCKSIRAARRNPSSSRLVTDVRIKLLDDIGFQWEVSTVTSFEERIAQLEEFKEKHGNLKVTNKLDKQLSTWCSNMRAARRNPKATGLVVSDERIKALDDLGFEWEVADTWGRENFSFEERIAQLKAYKETHGHVKVTQGDDKNLYRFCNKMRNSRIENEDVSEDMIKALDDLGFDWEVSKGGPDSFESRLEQLKSFKEQHGHVKVTDKLDKSLSRFCVRTRAARRNPEEGKSLSEEKIQALDNLGFDWDPLKDKITSFEERIVQLNAFKEKYGHVRVTKTDDKSLGEFCNNIRRARREPGSGISVSDERIKALDELGFDWGFSSAASDQEVEDEVGRTVDV